jgi:hypothetical protein
MSKSFTACLLFIIFSLIYYIGSFSKIPFGDCMAFIVITEQNEIETIATPMSHLLYVDTAILVKNVTGLNAIDANRLLVVFSAVVSLTLVYLTLRNLTKINWASIAATIVFGFSFTFWKNAEIVEVYTYNALWLTSFYFCIINAFISHKKNTYIILSGLFLGISIWLHIQNFLLIPAYILFLFYFKSERKSIAYSLGVFSILFSLLFIINYSQGESIYSPFLNYEGHWVEDSFKKSFSEYLLDLVKSVLYLIYNFNVFVVIGILGMTMLYKENRKMFYTFFLAAVCIYGFATFYAVSDNYIFFLPFNIIFALAIGYGLTSGKYLFFKKLSWICILIPVFYYLSFSIVSCTTKGKNLNDLKSYKGGLGYYMLPWMNHNKGILEFVIDKKIAPEPIDWMTNSANLYIEILKGQGYTEKEIRKL